LEEIIEQEIDGLKKHRNGVLIEVKLKPGSSRQRVGLTAEETVVVYVNSHPIGGKANQEMLRVLAKSLDVPASRLEIIKGYKSRNKTILAHGMTIEDAILKLYRLS
jgi:uncharacterized protein (TIGR00251 family)